MMRLTLANLPHPAISSRILDDHLSPLGLLPSADRLSMTGTPCRW